MADKQFLKGVVAGALCASLAIGGGFVAYAKAGYAGSSILSDVAVTQKIKYLEDVIEQDYLEDVDEDSLKEGLYTGLLYGIGDPYSRYYTEAEYEEEMKREDESLGELYGDKHQHTETNIEE